MRVQRMLSTVFLGFGAAVGALAIIATTAVPQDKTQVPWLSTIPPSAAVPATSGVTPAAITVAVQKPQPGGCVGECRTRVDAYLTAKADLAAKLFTYQQAIGAVFARTATPQQFQSDLAAQDQALASAKTQLDAIKNFNNGDGFPAPLLRTYIDGLKTVTDALKAYDIAVRKGDNATAQRSTEKTYLDALMAAAQAAAGLAVDVSKPLDSGFRKQLADKIAEVETLNTQVWGLKTQMDGLAGTYEKLTLSKFEVGLKEKVVADAADAWVTAVNLVSKNRKDAEAAGAKPDDLDPPTPSTPQNGGSGGDQGGGKFIKITSATYGVLDNPDLSCPATGYFKATCEYVSVAVETCWNKETGIRVNPCPGTIPATQFTKSHDELLPFERKLCAAKITWDTACGGYNPAPSAERKAIVNYKCGSGPENTTRGKDKETLYLSCE